jgi:hypothetical protein
MTQSGSGGRLFRDTAGRPPTPELQSADSGPYEAAPLSVLFGPFSGRIFLWFFSSPLVAGYGPSHSRPAAARVSHEAADQRGSLGSL